MFILLYSYQKIDTVIEFSSKGKNTRGKYLTTSLLIRLDPNICFEYLLKTNVCSLYYKTRAKICQVKTTKSCADQSVS